MVRNIKRTVAAFISAMLLAGCAQEEEKRTTVVPVTDEAQFILSDPDLEYAYRESVIRTALRDRIATAVDTSTNMRSAQAFEKWISANIPGGFHVDTELVASGTTGAGAGDYSFVSRFAVDISPVKDASFTAHVSFSQKMDGVYADADEDRVDDLYLDYRGSDTGEESSLYFMDEGEYFVFPAKAAGSLYSLFKRIRSTALTEHVDSSDFAAITDYLVDNLKLAEINEEQGYYRFDGAPVMESAPVELLRTVAKYYLTGTNLRTDLLRFVKDFYELQKLVKPKMTMYIGTDHRLQSIFIDLSGEGAAQVAGHIRDAHGYTDNGTDAQETEDGVIKDVHFSMNFVSNDAVTIPDEVAGTAGSYIDYLLKIGNTALVGRLKPGRYVARSEVDEAINADNALEYGLIERVLARIRAIENIDFIRSEYSDIDDDIRALEALAASGTYDDESVARRLYATFTMLPEADAKNRRYYANGVLLALDDEKDDRELVEMVRDVFVWLIKSSEPGDIVNFGRDISRGDYTAEWIVLDNDGSSAVLLNLGHCTISLFDRNSNEWRTSAVRESFCELYPRFAWWEQELMMQMTIGQDTDYIRLLTAGEAEKYNDVIYYSLLKNYPANMPDFDIWLSTPGSEPGTLKHYDVFKGVVDDGLRYDRLNKCTSHPVITVSFDYYRQENGPVIVENYTNSTE